MVALVCFVGIFGFIAVSVKLILGNNIEKTQRALDDILRQLIGKICYIYVNDVIIFSKDEQLHIEHVNQIFKKGSREDTTGQM